MKILILFLIVVAAAVAALWFLPWWLSLALFVIVMLPVAWIGWKIVSALKAVVNVIADAMPKKKLCSLASGERFQGAEFSFTLPVACEVSQIVIDDFEALMLKPQIYASDELGESPIVVSTILKEEMKVKITTKLEDVFSKIPGLRAGDFVPVQVGALQGERREFEASKDGKSIRGESVYLGDEDYSVTWVIVAPSDSFDFAAGKYREFAGLFNRIRKPAVEESIATTDRPPAS